MRNRVRLGREGREASTGDASARAWQRRPLDWRRTLDNRSQLAINDAPQLRTRSWRQKLRSTNYDARPIPLPSTISGSTSCARASPGLPSVISRRLAGLSLVT